MSQELLGAQAWVLCAAEVQAAGKFKHRSSQEGNTQKILREFLEENDPVILGLEGWGEDPCFGCSEQYTFHMKSPWDEISLGQNLQEAL